MLKNILPVFDVRAQIESDPSLPAQYQLVLEQTHYRLAQIDRANEHLDTKALGLLQVAGLILALTGVLKFPDALYGADVLVKTGIAVGFLAFAGMILLTLLTWSPANIALPGSTDWEEIYDKYVTVQIEQTFDQVLQDSLATQHYLVELNRRKANCLKWSLLLFFIQLAGLLLLALAS